jgi:hypothetical protein
MDMTLPSFIAALFLTVSGILLARDLLRTKLRPLLRRAR